MPSQAKQSTPVPDINTTIWEEYYASLKDSYLFPNEYVVRAFLGNYPGLKMVRNYKGANIGDISCGDGRNIMLLNKLGGNLYATELSEEVCALTRQKLLNHPERVEVDIRPGTNNDLPFEDNFFDYMLSWNACYYMESVQTDFATHVAEFARVIKPGGYLVACVPAPTCFSLQGAEKLGNDTVRINTHSQWSILNGSIYKLFDSPAAIERAFGSHFENFSHCSLHDDCFGQPLDYFIFVCQKR